MATEAIMKINNVSKFFGNTNILQNLNFEILPGEILGIIGASGSGKTTLLNMLIGFIRPSQGEILFRFEHLLNFKNAELYRHVHQKPLQVKKMIGFAAQKPSFYADLTIQENLEYFGKLFNLSNDEISSNIETILGLMELKTCRYQIAKKLSGGMQRRLDIACSLIHDPKVLILDEPTADLDPILRKHILNLLKLIKEKGTTIIISSHNLSEIELLCDRLAIIKDGTIFEINTFENIQTKYIKNKKLIIETESKDYFNLLQKLPDELIEDNIIDNNELTLSTKEPKELLKIIIKKIELLNEEIKNVSLTSPSLDEIFLSISKIDDQRTIKKLNFISKLAKESFFKLEVNKKRK